MFSIMYIDIKHVWWYCVSVNQHIHVYMVWYAICQLSLFYLNNSFFQLGGVWEQQTVQKCKPDGCCESIIHLATLFSRFPDLGTCQDVSPSPKCRAQLNSATLGMCIMCPVTHTPALPRSNWLPGLFVAFRPPGPLLRTKEWHISSTNDVVEMSNTLAQLLHGRVADQKPHSEVVHSLSRIIDNDAIFMRLFRHADSPQGIYSVDDVPRMFCGEL